MELDDELCYQAMDSRDRRFDGRFFIGVRTTGIYCRPICPAPKPRRKNVDFYACAAAAEAEGFRACRRCRPDAAPGTPVWNGASTTVSRALRLIADNALEEGGVEGLATRLGVGSRHLRRLFQEHLGASPLAVAHTQRLHLARRLLDDTTLPIADIAFASGFESIRRFNAAFKASFEMSPREARNAVKARKPGKSSGLELHLSYRMPFDWSETLNFLRPRALPGVEHVEDKIYLRAVRIGEDTGTVEVRDDPTRHCLILSAEPALARHALEIARCARRLFDLEADPEAVARCLAKDPPLRGIVNRHPGLRVPGAWDRFEVAVRAIVGQQVSVKGATTVAGVIVDKYGMPLTNPVHPAVRHSFPSPERLMRLRAGSLPMPSARIRTLRGLATALVAGDIDLSPGESLEASIAQLVTLPGIGPWTANYMAMRVIGEPDAFPAGDLGLQRAAAPRGQKQITERDLLKRAERWRPWRAYAAIYLWRKLADSGTISAG